MRKVLLVLAAVPLVVGPSVAHAEGSGGGSPCQVPKVDTHYDVDQLAVDVSLPAGGCPTREHRVFDLDTAVTRMDNNGSRDVSGRSRTCGPYRSAADVGPGEPAPQYRCDLSLAVDHPQVEVAQYDVDITYPGASGDRTWDMVLFCRSEGGNAACEMNAPPAERDAS